MAEARSSSTFFELPSRHLPLAYMVSKIWTILATALSICLVAEPF
jgi:hypothetical protein